MRPMGSVMLCEANQRNTIRYCHWESRLDVGDVCIEHEFYYISFGSVSIPNAASTVFREINLRKNGWKKKWLIKLKAHMWRYTANRGICNRGICNRVYANCAFYCFATCMRSLKKNEGTLTFGRPNEFCGTNQFSNVCRNVWSMRVHSRCVAVVFLFTHSLPTNEWISFPFFFLSTHSVWPRSVMRFLWIKTLTFFFSLVFKEKYWTDNEVTEWVVVFCCFFA